MTITIRILITMISANWLSSLVNFLGGNRAHRWMTTMMMMREDGSDDDDDGDNDGDHRRKHL